MGSSGDYQKRFISDRRCHHRSVCTTAARGNFIRKPERPAGASAPCLPSDGVPPGCLGSLAGQREKACFQPSILGAGRVRVQRQKLAKRCRYAPDQTRRRRQERARMQQVAQRRDFPSLAPSVKQDHTDVIKLFAQARWVNAAHIALRGPDRISPGGQFFCRKLSVGPAALATGRPKLTPQSVEAPRLLRCARRLRHACKTPSVFLHGPTPQPASTGCAFRLQQARVPSWLFAWR
ncbi:hypothetical protein AWB83_01946 [Caballeronia ptereochthonis]|uniref:Uncharacterized protein n=1 Tax=Caballeronia ptereochthonis TaxID=1777144 RepID=A0A158AJL7_9BURK|nr:hypothetical protein AWB83_01946 [Caballeronia ptereochthonis]